MGIADYLQSGKYPAEAFTPVPLRLIETATRLDSATAYKTLVQDRWQETGWADYLEQVRRAARALLAIGVKGGDTVCILGFNRPEWTISAHAAMMIGAAPAGIYFTSSAEEIEYILNHSQAPVLVAETTAHFDKVKKFETELFCLRRVVMMAGSPAMDPLQIDWERFMALGRADLQGQVEARLKSIKPADCGMRIYTSGTTGPPKSVVLSHGALSWTSWTLKNMFGTDASARMISYLPLAHIAEASNSIHNHATGGYTLAFARSIETLGDHLKDIRPTVLFGVPRVWQKIHETLTARLSEAKGARGRLARWAVRTGLQSAERKMDGRWRSPLLLAKLAIAERLVLSKIRAATGLDQCKLPVSGAAPIQREILAFFAGIGIVIYEVYGQSEDCGPTTFNVPGAVKLGTVGKPIPGMELKIAPDEEILIWAPNLFDGYAKNPEATAETFAGGWMRTGDLGRLDNEGYLTITGRKKDILITSGGKNITPANLENDLALIPQVEHAVVCGEGRHYLAALLTLKPGSKLEGEALREAIQAGIDAMNERYARAENIRKFTILPKRLTLETGELTPTLKVKRGLVLRKYAPLVEKLYAND